MLPIGRRFGFSSRFIFVVFLGREQHGASTDVRPRLPVCSGGKLVLPTSRPGLAMKAVVREP